LTSGCESKKDEALPGHLRDNRKEGTFENSKKAEHGDIGRFWGFQMPT